VGTERAAVIPPQSFTDIPGLRLPIAIRRTPLLRLAYLSEVPHDLAPYWLSAPAAWLLSTSRCSSRGDAPSETRRGISPSGFAPLQSMTQVAAHRRARSQRFFDPLALPSRRDPPLPGFTLPGSRCALTLTTRLGAFLPRRPPWYCFQPGALSGSSPFRA